MTAEALPSADQPPDPCAVLHESEVDWALGAVFTSQDAALALRNGADRICVWSRDKPPIETADFFIASAASLHASMGMTVNDNYAAFVAPFTDGESVRGLGVAALYSPRSLDLYVRLPTAWFGLGAEGVPVRDPKGALISLARLVLSRYKG